MGFGGGEEEAEEGEGWEEEGAAADAGAAGPAAVDQITVK